MDLVDTMALGVEGDTMVAVVRIKAVVVEALATPMARIYFPGQG
jgi:hypothetical protein